MTRKTVLSWILFLLVAAAIAGVIKSTINAHNWKVAEQKRHDELVKGVRTQIVLYRDEVHDPSSSKELCQSETAHRLLEDIHILMDDAKDFGLPISNTEIDDVSGGMDADFELKSQSERFGVLLLEAYKNNSGVNCNDGAIEYDLRYGKNSYTLTEINNLIQQDAISPFSVGLGKQGVRPLAIDLLKSWIADRKAGRNPHADNRVEEIATRFSISNFDVGVNTSADTRKYFQEIPD